jgi:hypothetical protein
MDRENTYQGSVCVDCLFALANGDEPNWMTPDQLQEWRDNITRNHAGVHDVALGHFHDSNRCYHKGEECQDDCECERAGFATSACDNCGSTLAGQRDDVVFWLAPTMAARR